MKKVVHVTKPTLPPLNEFIPYLEDIWESKFLTNNGIYNSRLCKALADEWDVEHVVLFANGTQALIAALSCLNDEEKGEIITTPYTFIATTNSIVWSGHSPIFVDIDEQSSNIDVNAIERAINEKTKAILAVHCYGEPCNLEALHRISEKYNLPVIYDSAHAFGVEVGTKSLMSYGAMSVMSFHATKVFNTFEGGAVACHSTVTRNKLRDFANFGFQNETTIASLGLNAKLSEFNAALGLLQLQYINKAIEERKRVASLYRQQLSGIKGISWLSQTEGVNENCAYFPIFIKNTKSVDRDELYIHLKSHGYMVRRYFYPLTCDFGVPEVESSAVIYPIPRAKKRAEEVLCLPIYPDLSDQHISTITALIKDKMSMAE